MMSLTDELGVLKLVTARLEAAAIAYMLTGSIAAGYYSEPRMTRDIDLVVELDASDAERVSTLFAADFLVEPETIAAAIRRRGMFNLIHGTATVKVDMIVRKDTPYRHQEFQRRRQVIVDGQPMWLVSPEDLILSKLERSKDSRSELQRRDIRGLLRDALGLDHGYLNEWTGRLGIQHLLDEERHV